MEILVVGKGGTLGAAIARRLGCAAIELRASDTREGSAIDEVAAADVVVNASGPRVRAGLDRADYFREHVGIATRVGSADVGLAAQHCPHGGVVRSVELLFAKDFARVHFERRELDAREYVASCAPGIDPRGASPAQALERANARFGVHDEH